MSSLHREPPGDLPPEEFRRLAHEVADWIADYFEGVEELPVSPGVRPGFLREALPPAAPEEPESMDAILEDFRRLILPGITHWNHPSFHAWFAISGSGPGVLGEMIAAALNVNAMVWRASPAATELEEHTLDWLRAALGLPEDFHGTINDTASHSTLYALAAARERAAPEQRTEGLSGGLPLRCYASVEAHSSVDKAVLTLGLGREGMVRIPTNGVFELDVEALRVAIRRDRESGFRPMAVVATLGTTSTTSVDPVAAVAEVCREEGLWLHVDAAYGGPLALLPELHDLFYGWERADSVVVNPHKWLFTPVDCSILYCRRPDALRRAFSLVPEYLRAVEEGGTDLMDYGVALGRRFRSLKLWFVMRAFGLDGLRERLRHHLELAGEWAARVEETPGWELAAPCPMATPIFRWVGDGLDPEASDAFNEALMNRVNRSGEAFLSHTGVDGRVALRLSIGNIRTARRHLAATWSRLQHEARDLSEG